MDKENMNTDNKSGNANSGGKSGESRSKKRKRVVVDAEYEWESLHHKPIRMNKRNVNQNLAGKHSGSRKRDVPPSGKAMLIFLLGMLGAVAFILVCTYMGVKVRRAKAYVSETLATKGTAETSVAESDTEAITEGQSEETVIAESVAPVEKIEELDVIGGNGELVGFSFPSQYKKEWVLMEKEFSRALEAAGYEGDFRYAEKYTADAEPTEGAQSVGSSQDEIVKQQIDDIRELQKEGAKVIFVFGADSSSEELGKVLNDVKNSGIYVVALDHVPMHTDGVNYLFGCDDYHVGEALGWYIVDELDLINASAEDPKYIEIFTGDFTDETLYFLYPGLMDILFPYIDTGALKVGSGQFELEQVSVMDNSRQEAKIRMEELLTGVYGKRELDAVICTNDVLAAGVSEAIEMAVQDGAYNGNIPLITGDGCDDEALERILQGSQSMSVFHDPLQYAYRGTELVDRILHGEEPEITDSEMYQNGNFVVPAVELSPQIVTSDNYDEMIVRRGYMQTSVLID